MSGQYFFPSEEWAEEYCKKLSGSVEYRNTAKTWEGSILFVCRDLPENVKRVLRGRDRVAFELDLLRGECRGFKWYFNPEESKAPYVIEGSYEDWVKVISGRLGPIPALMSGRLKVVRGSLATLMRYAPAALAMVKTAQQVPTRLD